MATHVAGIITRKVLSVGDAISTCNIHLGRNVYTADILVVDDHARDDDTSLRL
jgi:hypothetical protein